MRTGGPSVDQLISQALAEKRAVDVSGRVTVVGGPNLIEKSRFLSERPRIIEVIHPITSATSSKAGSLRRISFRLIDDSSHKCVGQPSGSLPALVLNRLRGFEATYRLWRWSRLTFCGLMLLTALRRRSLASLRLGSRGVGNLRLRSRSMLDLRRWRSLVNLRLSSRGMSNLRLKSWSMLDPWR